MLLGWMVEKRMADIVGLMSYCLYMSSTILAFA